LGQTSPDGVSPDVAHPDPAVGLSLWDWIAERNKQGQECGSQSACPYVMASVAIKIFQELEEGVFYIHNMRIVHRYLKPRNIFLMALISK